MEKVEMPTYCMSYLFSIMGESPAAATMHKNIIPSNILMTYSFFFVETFAIKSQMKFGCDRLIYVKVI